MPRRVRFKVHAHKYKQQLQWNKEQSIAAVYRSFINSMKEKTKEMREDWSKYKKSRLRFLAEGTLSGSKVEKYR
jgi:hypothetical protein